MVAWHPIHIKGTNNRDLLGQRKDGSCFLKRVRANSDHEQEEQRVKFHE